MWGRDGEREREKERERERERKREREMERDEPESKTNRGRSASLPAEESWVDMLSFYTAIITEAKRKDAERERERERTMSTQCAPQAGLVKVNWIMLQFKLMPCLSVPSSTC